MINMKKITVLMLATAIVLSAGFDAFARQATLVLKDGRKIKGELVSESATAVTIKIGGIPTPFPRTRVQDVIYELTVEEEYKQKREDIKANDYDARYELASWLNGKYKETKNVKALKLAEAEVNSLLKANPNHFRAKLLKRVVDASLKLEGDNAKDSPSTPDKPATQEKDDTPGTPIKAEKGDYLTDDQIAMIKTMEVNLETSPPPRISIPRNVVTELFKKYRDQEALKDYLGKTGEGKFRALPPHKQMDIIFGAQARDLYDKVIIRDEPLPLRTFRTKFHAQMVQKYCGQCHTAGDAVGMRLVPGKPNDEKVAYTNYIIMRRTRVGPDQVLNLNQPSKSLLIQYALPRAQATTPHPEVPGLRRYFTTSNDPRIKDLMEWMQKEIFMKQAYPIDYSPPKAKPSKSASKPAEPANDTPTETDKPTTDPATGK